MRAELLKQTLTARAKLHLSGTRVRPAYITGPPGVGKTQVVGQVARDLGIGSHELHAPLMLNEDFGITVLMVTHEDEVARYSKRVILVRDGLIESDVTNTQRPH